MPKLTRVDRIETFVVGGGGGRTSNCRGVRFFVLLSKEFKSFKLFSSGRDNLSLSADVSIRRSDKHYGYQYQHK